MRIIKIILLLIISLKISAQEVKKPKTIYILNDEKIITEQQVGKIAKNGNIKELVSGASAKERNIYKDKFPGKIEDNFIARVYTKARNIELTEKTLEEYTFTNNIKINEFAPDFKVELTNGESIKLSDLRGKVVMLNFWATWCVPCLKEFYELPEPIFKKFINKEFIFLPISKGESKEKVVNKLKTLKERGVSLNSGIDENEAISKLYGESMIPKNIIIDKDGYVRQIAIGYNQEKLKELEVIIENLL